MSKYTLEQFNALSKDEQLKLVNQLAEAKQSQRVTYKVSRKGALSVYGINTQFPVTLYASQWEVLFDHVAKMKAYIAGDPVTSWPEKDDKPAVNAKLVRRTA